MTKKMTNFERLSIVLQASALPCKTKDDEIDADFIREVIFAGHEWALSWKYHWLDSNERHEMHPIVEEVIAIFDMYQNLQFSGKSWD